MGAGAGAGAGAAGITLSPRRTGGAEEGVGATEAVTGGDTGGGTGEAITGTVPTEVFCKQIKKDAAIVKFTGLRGYDVFFMCGMGVRKGWGGGGGGGALHLYGRVSVKRFTSCFGIGVRRRGFFFVVVLKPCVFCGGRRQACRGGVLFVRQDGFGGLAAESDGIGADVVEVPLLCE